jgi:hypothetical protein
MGFSLDDEMNDVPQTSADGLVGRRHGGRPKSRDQLRQLIHETVPQLRERMRP